MEKGRSRSKDVSNRKRPISTAASTHSPADREPSAKIPCLDSSAYDYSIFRVDHGVMVRVPNISFTRKEMRKRDKDLDSILIRLEEFNQQITELAKQKNLNLKNADPIQVKIDEYRSKYMRKKVAKS